MAKNRKYQKRHRETIEGFEPVANPERAQWMHQLTASSATRKHVPLPRKGSRAQRKAQALRDQSRHRDQ